MFCAGSCPVAMKTADTMLAAWALNPPRAPAMAEPTIDLPRPSIQLTAAGFLSEQKLPEMPMISMSGKSVCRKSNTFWTPLGTMFISMTSPVLQVNLMYRFLPAIAHLMLWRRPKRLDLLKAPEMVSKLEGSSKYSFN